MMTALLSDMNRLIESSGPGSFGVDKVEEHGAGNGDRPEGDERGDGDGRVGLVESRLGDGRGSGEGERQVLRVRPGERGAEHLRLRR